MARGGSRRSAVAVTALTTGPACKQRAATSLGAALDQFGRQQQAEAPHRPDTLQRSQLFLQIVPPRLGQGRDVELFHDRQGGAGGGGGQRLPAESRGMVARDESWPRRPPAPSRPLSVHRCQGLWPRSRRRVARRSAGSPTNGPSGRGPVWTSSTMNRMPALVAQLAHALEVLLAGGPDPSLTLDRLEQHGRHLGRIALSRAPESCQGTWRKPSGRGWNGSCLAGWPVA